MSWTSLGEQSARQENERIEQRRNAYYSAEIVSNPIRQMHETLKEIQVLLTEVLEAIRKNQND